MPGRYVKTSNRVAIVVLLLLLAGGLAWGLYASGDSNKALCPPGNPHCSELPPLSTPALR